MEPSWEPSDVDALDETKHTIDCINLARANHRRLDQDISNIEKQGYWPQLKDKSTSALLQDPTLAMLIDINPMDTVNPDQDIAPTFKHVISKAHGNMPPASKLLANGHAPSGKLCGTITFDPTFEHALARLLNRYSNKHTMENKTTRIKNH